MANGTKSGRVANTLASSTAARPSPDLDNAYQTNREQVIPNVQRTHQDSLISCLDRLSAILGRLSRITGAVNGDDSIEPDGFDHLTGTSLVPMLEAFPEHHEILEQRLSACCERLEDLLKL